MRAGDLIGQGLAAVGVALMGLAAVGLIRLPDAYNRANAVSKAAALGAGCVLLGVLALMPSLSSAIVLGLGIVLQVVTTPLGAYAVSRAAHRSGAPFVASTRHDPPRGRPTEVDDVISPPDSDPDDPYI